MTDDQIKKLAQVTQAGLDKESKMANRATLMVGDYWPIISVPNPVRETFRRHVARLPPEIQIRELGQGYHNAGWSYTEVKVKALTVAQAEEYADQILKECYFDLQMMDGER
jgi:hypothetical protein